MTPVTAPEATPELVRDSDWRHEATTPNVMDVLRRGETSVAAWRGPLDAERREALRELAEWSVTSADLDWEHAEDIDRRGWGLDPA